MYGQMTEPLNFSLETFPENLETGVYTPVSKFLGAHIPLKKPIIRERMNQVRIFAALGGAP